ncbi:MAG: glycosyl hydrolase [Bacteroidota bacterium]
MPYLKHFPSFSLFMLISFSFLTVHAQNDLPDAVQQAANSLSLRAIGPAVMGGRISDIAVSPHDPSTWYVSAGSGNLWKTINRGITWEPVFDDQTSYSIGTISIDPNNAGTLWVGTGENVSGRHVGWGDGVYRSRDGGKSWQNMGLKKSEHIGKILIDPRNSDVILVAAEGPLWSSGGERGVFKTKDGGKSWDAVLQIDEHTGITDLEFDPSNPDVIYAAAYQRRRHTWSLLAGGPKSGIYKSTDNGNSWRRLTTGLPTGDKGKIGLAVTPANPNLVYATIEADEKEKGFYRSLDKGESWEKRNDYISGGTGPHYYQEIEASPENPDLVYQMDVFLHVTRDGGKNFDYLGTGREKHSDNHALWIDPHNGQHLLAGTDGGLYESFDEGSTWRHFANLPISQFYKLGLDNAEPFYNIVGGAQDLGTLLGPSRTMNAEGVRNQDWYVPLGADGYESQFDPDDPQIAYMEYQQGVLHRLDRRNEEVLNIQPQPAPNDPPERWNWDSPLIISPHKSQRLYFGSQRLWKSEDRGNSWTAISEDLTTNTNRYELEMIDRVWSVDALYDNGAMSQYATLTALSESPKAEGLLYTGSDDGLIHVSEDGGQSWRKAAPLPGVPARAFINDVEASIYDPNVVFAAADAHKLGDYRPYLFRSNDRGKSWQAIRGDLPESTIVWALKQDHKAENLLFIGTEYGLCFSYDGGKHWVTLGGGVPTIPFRDIELHPRENDVVGATFGRGFYVLDDYSCLRELSQVVQESKAAVFSVRDAWWYVPSVPMQAKGMPSQGSDGYVGENPAFGATFTYYLPEMPQTAKAKRRQTEKGLRQEGKSILFPGWETLQTEATEGKPQALLLVKDESGGPIRWLKGATQKGLHRVNWDLRWPAPNPVRLTKPAFQPPWAGNPQGPLAMPGTYSVELFIAHNGQLSSQGNPQTFQVKAVPNLLEKPDFKALEIFQKESRELRRQISGAGRQLSEARGKLRHIKAALSETSGATAAHFTSFQKLQHDLMTLQRRLSGDPQRQKLEESSQPSISNRAYHAANQWNTRQMPTQTNQENLEIASREYAQFAKDLKSFFEGLSDFEGELEKAGAPYTPGRRE